MMMLDAVEARPMSRSETVKWNIVFEEVVPGLVANWNLYLQQAESESGIFAAGVDKRGWMVKLI